MIALNNRGGLMEKITQIEAAAARAEVVTAACPLALAEGGGSSPPRRFGIERSPRITPGMEPGARAF